jgi:hypothetical protein
MTHFDTLTANGFVETGVYAYVNADSQLALTGEHPTTPGCYAFMLGDECVYVGVAQRRVQGRVWDYRRPDAAAPNAPRSQMWAACSLGTSFRVFTCATQATTLPSGLPCPAKSVALMLESALIDAISPRFNTLNCTRS